MIDNISFLNQNWFWQVVLITLVIWLVFLWKEYTKVSRKRFYFNAVVSLVALISLALIALKPTISTTSKSFKAAITTNDYNKTQLDSLKKEYKDLTVYNYEENGTLVPKDKNPETVFVLGNGLQQYNLWQLDSLNTIYIGGNTPKGIINFKYDAHTIVGNEATFKGEYAQPTKGHKLFLENPAGNAIDSIELSDIDVQDFELTTKMKVKGGFMYQLVEKDSIETVVYKNPIPLIVAKQKQLQILIVNAMPSFETKYLKNYLAEAGHKVVVQSRLTKSRYKYEYFNIDKKPTIRFSQEQLKLYDLVVIDFQTLNSLSRNAKNAIKASVTEDGLGVFIQPEISVFNSHNRWYSFNFTSNTKGTTVLDISPKSNINKYPFLFKDGISIEPTIRNNSKILSAYKRLGIGRVGTSALQDTYTLQLKGKTKVYKQLWAKTIESMSKKELSNVEWNSNSVIAYQNEPFNFQLRTNEESPAVTTNKGHQIAMKQDINIKTLWYGTTYPKVLGWNKLKIEQDTTNIFKYFVTDDSSWESLKIANTIKANQNYFATKNEGVGLKRQFNKPINSLWFFVIFIVCIGYLWLVPKL